MSIKIIALSDTPLDEDYHFYASFLNEVVENTPEEGVSVTGTEGSLRNGLHFKAMEVEVTVPDGVGGGVWVVIPKSDPTQNDVDYWVDRMARDTVTDGIFGIHAGDNTARANDYGFCYKAVTPIEMFDMLVKGA